MGKRVYIVFMKRATVRLKALAASSWTGFINNNKLQDKAIILGNGEKKLV